MEIHLLNKTSGPGLNLIGTQINLVGSSSVVNDVISTTKIIFCICQLEALVFNTDPKY